MRIVPCFARVAAVVLLLSSLMAGESFAQPGAALAGLLGNATDMSFYWQYVGARSRSLRPESAVGAKGVGFEFAFALPGPALTRRIALDQQPEAKDSTSCLFRYLRLRSDAARAAKFSCVDTTWTLAERLTQGGQRTVKETVKEISRFDPEAAARTDLVTLELAVGFSQAGGFLAREPAESLRVAVREIPSASIYATIGPDLPVSPYIGMRTGLFTLQGGRLYNGSTMTKFGGDTFQLGGVFGLVAEVVGLNVFVEGSYMRRAFDSVDWEGSPPGNLRSLSLSGPALAFGGQFRFREHGGK